MSRLALLCAAAWLCACSGGQANQGPITIGISASLTGDLLAYTSDLLRVATLAFQEINEQGGVLGGRSLTVDVEDDGTTEDGAKAAYGTLRQRGVPVVLGPRFSAGVLAVAPQIKSGMTLTISSSATAPTLTTLDTGGNFHRTVPSDVWQGVVLGQLVADAARQNVCVIHRNDAYGTGLADRTIAKLQELAPTISIVRAPYDPSAGDLSHVLDACDPMKGLPMPALVFITFTADGAVIIEDAGKRGWAAAEHRFFLCDGNKDPMLLSQLSDPLILEGATGTSASGPDATTPAGDRLAAFQQRYMTRFSSPPPKSSFAENMYDSAYVAAMAIELAGSATDRTAIRQSLAAMSTGTAANAGDWTSIKRAIRTQKSVNYAGASGEVDFDPATSDILPPYYYTIWGIVGGIIQNMRIVTIDG